MVSKNGDVLLVGKTAVFKYDLEKEESASVLELASAPDLSYAVPLNDNLICCAYNR